MTKLVERLEKPSTAYGMEISAEKTKLMTNDNKEIKGNGHKLQTVTNFRYMCSVKGVLRVPDPYYHVFIDLKKAFYRVCGQ